MEKNKRSSFKGNIGTSWGTMDARVFKTAERIKAAKENLQSTEGCIKLLKNSNPDIWLMVMANLRQCQHEGGWHGYPRTEKLDKALKHRVVHILRLDDKKYISRKTLIIEFLKLSKLYHPKFLKDYIEYIYTLHGYLSLCDPLTCKKY